MDPRTRPRQANLGQAPPGQALPGQALPGQGSVPRWVPALFAGLSVALVPGIARLFVSSSAPHLTMHWRLAWTGFDFMLAGMLVTTGFALRRRSALAQVLAAITAALLCCDAWTDVLTTGGHGKTAGFVAIAEALLAELPLAVVFGLIAVRSARAVARPILPRWLPTACFVLGAALVPWSFWLFATLPPVTWTRNWHLANAGLDLALALALGAGAIALIRRWPVTPAIVAMAAALLLRDAWFNVLTARPGHAAMAIAVAGGLELPLAALCLLIASGAIEVRNSALGGKLGVQQG